MAYKFFMSPDVYEKYITVFNDYMEGAKYYCPTKEEVEKMKDNLKEYFLLLMWVEETGYETEENIEDRKYVRDLLKEILAIQ